MLMFLNVADMLLTPWQAWFAEQTDWHVRSPHADTFVRHVRKLDGHVGGLSDKHKIIESAIYYLNCLVWDWLFETG